MSNSPQAIPKRRDLAEGGAVKVERRGSCSQSIVQIQQPSQSFFDSFEFVGRQRSNPGFKSGQ
jgi:hypothetical protein